ncbi:hypothetical protein [uncultured Pseudoteredinibacter sp.]|uniref:hypothetical protein n=1 Tax=uncultured Pseudoteredinibacter sp. TaxID=1641701 RepID=UPI002629ADA5|nr:hypothetical protein [uncultured Pseudoteredinibacter sp.]
MKYLKLALIPVLFSSASFADFEALTSETISNANITTPGFTENISGDAIVFCLGAINGPLQDNDEITLTLSDDARFASSTMSLELAVGGAGNGNITFASQSPADANGQQSVSFTVDNAASLGGQVFSGSASDPGMCIGTILSGQTIAGQGVDFSFTNPWNSTEVTINGTLTRGATSLVSGSVLLFSLPQPPAKPVPSLPLVGLGLLAGLLGFVGLRRSNSKSNKG